MQNILKKIKKIISEDKSDENLDLLISECSKLNEKYRHILSIDELIRNNPELEKDKRLSISKNKSKK